MKLSTKFSTRLPWETPPNRLSVAVQAARAGGAAFMESFIDLTVSNPTRAMPEIYEGGVGGGETSSLLLPLADARGLQYVPSPQGALAARESIAAYYAARGVAVAAEELVLCASTSEAYTWLFQLLCEPGERVLCPQPSYPLLEFLAGVSAVQLQYYPLEYDGGRWFLGLHALSAACTAQTRAVVVVNPNNPTGSYLRRSELFALCALCRQRGLVLIVDEVFSDYLLVDPPGPTARHPRDLRDQVVPSVIAAVRELGEEAPLCFVLSGLSKVVGLPQLKLGWVHVSGPALLQKAAQDRLELIADTFLSVGTPVQLATPRLLAEQPRIHAAITARLRTNLRLLADAVRDTACELLPVEGGWYAVLRLPRLLGEEDLAILLLAQDGVLVHPGYFYDFDKEAYLVLSLLCEPAAVAQGAQRIVARVASL